MFQDIPYGSPLDPNLARRPVGALAAHQAPAAPLPALMAPQAPTAPPAALTSIPTPPASIKRKKLNMFDREHVAKMLAQIGKGFAGAKSFGEGLSASAAGIADGVMSEVYPAKPTTEIGGPDNAFEITTDAEGNRTYKPIAEVNDYLAAKKRRDSAPKPKDTAEFLGDSAYAIEQLDPEARPGAYRDMLEQAAAAGHDVSRVPPEYNPSFSKVLIGRTIGARQGSANEATLNYRREVNEDRDASREMNRSFRERADGRASAASGRAAASHSRSMRKAPPGARRSKTNDLDYLR